MKKEFILTTENFDALLKWLSEDREEAGRHYESIREGLVRFFRFRGCADPLELADITINRVAKKVSGFDNSKNIKKISFFYGFASNVFMEYTRDAKRREISLDSEELLNYKAFKTENNAVNVENDCLETCLAKLPDDEAKLLIQYYSKEKSEKFEMRKKLAESLNLKANALHIKIFRLRSALRECIENCLQKK